ncbi:MAG: 4'-phosphopantetheinyl transferase superfamily protein [Myxococcota bacterium]
MDLPPDWLPAGLHGATLAIDGPVPALAPGERVSPAAVAVRQREFAFGRACARAAVAAAGGPPGGIPSRPDRTPVFPDGIDVEPDLPHPELVPIVATPVECAGLGPGRETLLFSAKEAVFKCWFTAGGGRIAEFDEFELAVGDDGRLGIVRQPEPRIGAEGRWARRHGHWWTAWWLSTGPDRR